MTFRSFCLLALGASAAVVCADTPPTPTIATYAGLNFTGPVNSWYDIEATTDLSDPESWSVVASLPVKPGSNLWVDTAVPVVGKRFYRLVDIPVQPVPNMVAINPGTFVMGSADTEVGWQVTEGPQTQVTLTKGFYMGKYEVTQAEYLAVTVTNPSGFTGDTSRPVEQVTWNDAVAYCAALTATERVAGRCPAGWSYRLPTEAEWEYACRAGTTTRFSYGDDDSVSGNYAWFVGNSGATTHPVGQKAPNPWGLYDMHGNVWEWCQDSWDGSANYPGGVTIDPLVSTGSNRVFRGGGWSYNAGSARWALRIGLPPILADVSIGFRVVLAPGQ